MRISGRRADGALYLSMGAGVAVILRGDRVSPPIDETAMDMLGPWNQLADDNTDETKRAVERRLDAARVSTDIISLGLMSFEDGKKKKDEAVSDVAESAQKTEEGAPVKDVEVINLQPDAVAATDEPPNPHFPAEERTKKRHALKDKIRGSLKSQKKVADVLDDKDITDDDLYAMAKSLGITVDEVPNATNLAVDNPTKFRRLLASTTLVHHLADKQEHPFTYCKEHIIPKMAAEGKAPEDEDAFCAWWKQENG